jgi:hypothetical protein
MRHQEIPDPYQGNPNPKIRIFEPKYQEFPDCLPQLQFLLLQPKAFD